MNTTLNTISILAAIDLLLIKYHIWRKIQLSTHFVFNPYTFVTILHKVGVLSRQYLL